MKKQTPQTKSTKIRMETFKRLKKFCRRKYFMSHFVSDTLEKEMDRAEAVHETDGN